jgi:hypothetical protein
MGIGKARWHGARRCPYLLAERRLIEMRFSGRVTGMAEPTSVACGGLEDNNTKEMEDVV